MPDPLDAVREVFADLGAKIRAVQSVDHHWYRREQLGCLRTMLADYRRLPQECEESAEWVLVRVRDLLEELEAELPPEPLNPTLPPLEDAQ
jgi:hypothetical protein